MSNQGLRILGVAKASLKQSILPVEQHDFQFEFLGLIGFSDPVRPGIPDAIAQCYNAGIRVAMITGDYPGTAQSIARQIGLIPADDFITGPQLNEVNGMTVIVCRGTGTWGPQMRLWHPSEILRITLRRNEKANIIE